MGWFLLEDYSHFLEVSRQCVIAWPVTASSPAGATSTSSTWSWPSLARSRLSSTSSRWCATTSDLPPPTRPLVTCLPSMRRCKQLHLSIQIAEEEAPPPQYDESMTLASNV